MGRVAPTGQAGLGVCHRAGRSSGKSGAGPLFFWLTLSGWGGWQICGELRELLSHKEKPHVVSPKGEGKGQSATGRAGGRRRVKGARNWGWELEEQLNLISNRQHVDPKHKGWHFRYCWGKLSPRLPTAPFLCIVENHGKKPEPKQ